VPARAAGPGAQRYAALVEAVLAAAASPAADRYDALLDRARADGAVDDATARALRWWHRASLREMSDQVTAALPAALDALDRARAEAETDATRSALAWEQAAGSVSSGAPAGPALVVGLTVLSDHERVDRP
jgi:hypothetical protein